MVFRQLENYCLLQETAKIAAEFRLSFRTQLYIGIESMVSLEECSKVFLNFIDDVRDIVSSKI